MTRKTEINGRSGLKKMLAGVSAGALLVAFCIPALAADDDTKAEIRLLKEQLRRLEKKLDAQAEAQKETQREVSTVVKTKGTGMAAGPIAGATAKDPNASLWPNAFYFKNVSITPGGFFEFAPFYRDHGMGSDIATPFSLIPYPNNPGAHTPEFRFSSRRSRFILQTDADLDDITHARMYLATDFLSGPQTATLTQSDSWALRWRELYTKIDRQDFGADYASHFSAGQMYTLFSLNSKGTTPDTFLTPPVIDDQYMPGYTWARQVGLRWSQNFTKDFQLAYGAEYAYTSIPGGTTPGLAWNNTTAPIPFNLLSGVPPYTSTFPAGYIPGAYVLYPISGSLYNNLNAVTMTHVPDQIVKAAWDPDLWGHSLHVEGGGILRQFEDRTFGGTHDVWGEPASPAWSSRSFRNGSTSRRPASPVGVSPAMALRARPFRTSPSNGRAVSRRSTSVRSCSASRATWTKRRTSTCSLAASSRPRTGAITNILRAFPTCRLAFTPSAMAIRPS